LVFFARISGALGTDSLATESATNEKSDKEVKSAQKMNALARAVS